MIAVHALLGAFLLGAVIGLIAGGFAVAAVWCRAVDQATTLPDPRTDVTERIDPLPVHDLPRRGTHFEEYA